MPLETYLKTFQFSEYHDIVIEKDAKSIFPLIRKVNFKDSRMIRFLFAIRGLPTGMDTLDGFLENGFILLEEHECKEIIMGFHFNMAFKEKQRVLPEHFAEFCDGRSIKGVWNFTLNESDNGSVLATETRVFCPTRTTKLFFSIYWFCISYFSGLVRMEILKLIKKKAEQEL